MDMNNELTSGTLVTVNLPGAWAGRVHQISQVTPKGYVVVKGWHRTQFASKGTITPITKLIPASKVAAYVP